MIFPRWTNLSKMNKKQKAVARLRYMISRLACEAGPKNTIKSVADLVDVDYSTICVYIERGVFSANVADKLEGVFGPELAPSAGLQDPLSIK